MGAPEITDEAIEAVMNVIWRPQHANEERLAEMRRDARDALEAAIPLLALGRRAAGDRAGPE